MRQIPDNSVDLILTDIPYNISKDNNFKTMKGRTGRNGIDFGEWDRGFDESQISVLIPKLKRNGSLFVFHSFNQFAAVSQALNNGMIFKDLIVWHKTNPMPRNRDRRYVSNVEIASWYIKQGGTWTFNRQSETYDGCILKYPSESGGGYKRYHPCQKNCKMLEDIILRHTNEGDVVLDPYVGSGSTGVAALNTNRKFYGIELDPTYCDIAKNRIQDVEAKCS